MTPGAGPPDKHGPQWSWDWGKWRSSTPGRGSFSPPFSPTFSPTFSPNAAGADSRQVLEKLVSVLRSRLLGRRLTLRTQRGEVALTLTDLEVPLERATLAMGQLDDITAVADDVTWADMSFHRVRATLRNPHLRMRTSPELVAAPVDLRVTLAEADLAALVARARPELWVEVTRDGVLAVRARRHPSWGRVEVDAGVDGTRLWVRPRALVREDRRMRLARRLPPFSARLPLPADRVVVTGIEPRSGAVEIVGRLDEVRIPVPSGGLEELVRRMGAMGSLLDVTRWRP